MLRQIGRLGGFLIVFRAAHVLFSHAYGLIVVDCHVAAGVEADRSGGGDSARSGCYKQYEIFHILSYMLCGYLCGRTYEPPLVRKTNLFARIR